MPSTISRRAVLAATLAPALPGVGAGLELPADTTGALPWLTAGRPTALADQALALLAQADSHGLVAQDYGLDRLDAALAHARRHALATAESTVLANTLDDAFRRYLLHLHRGRVDPRQVHHDFDVTRRPLFDADAALRQAAAAGRLADAVAAAVPALPQYQRLRAALAQLQALDGHAAWRTPLPAQPLDAAAADSRWAPEARARLAARLRALGDLDPLPPPAGPAGPDHQPTSDALATAVQRFQARHGLLADGVVGRATRAQLEVPPAARARQVVLALERLRWTPLLQGPRMIVVNIPEFRLRAYDVVEGRIVLRHDMAVVVGQALRHQTPLFDEDMRRIEFAPHWNVPLSIARQELVPRLRRDPGHLAREDFEFVGPGGTVEHGVTAGRLQSVLAGTWRLRQRPGPRNALGGIKFVFPNRDAIYLHHTPATGLFAQARRDFSHGCIRVEDPLALAGFVLQGQDGWDEARIRAAMAGSTTQVLALQRPVPVLIAYGTALVKDGRTHFFDDLYGHDRTLDNALRRAATAPPTTPDAR